jgi:DNA-binding beta-propeller fold protein YncE
VIDLEADPPHVIDKVVVGDGPDGFAISPTGKIAVAVLLHGTNAAKNAFHYHRNAVIVALNIDGKKVTRGSEVEVRGLPEGVVFSPDGRYVYVANWGEQNLVPYQLQGDKLVAVGTPLKLPGHPVSMRSSTP